MSKPASQGSLLEQLFSLQGNIPVSFASFNQMQAISIEPIDHDRSLQLGFSLLPRQCNYTVEKFRNELVRAIVDRHIKTSGCDTMDLTEPLVNANDNNLVIEKLELVKNAANEHILNVIFTRYSMIPVQSQESETIDSKKIDAEWLSGFRKWRNFKQK